MFQEVSVFSLTQSYWEYFNLGSKEQLFFADLSLCFSHCLMDFQYFFLEFIYQLTLHPIQIKIYFKFKNFTRKSLVLLLDNFHLDQIYNLFHKNSQAPNPNYKTCFLNQYPYDLKDSIFELINLKRPQDQINFAVNKY